MSDEYYDIQNDFGFTAVDSDELVTATGESAGINEELEAYNPLIPDGTNWKATFMIEFGDPVVRAERLREMRGIENCINLEIEGHGIAQVIADEDLERETDEKTSAVQSALSDLLEHILTSSKLSVKEKRKKLHKFKESYPMIYRNKFPSVDAEPEWIRAGSGVAKEASSSSKFSSLSRLKNAIRI